VPSGPIGQVGMIEGSQDVSEKTFEVTHDPLKVEGTGPLGEVVDVLDELDEVVVEFLWHLVSFPDTAPRPAIAWQRARSQPLGRPTCRPGYVRCKLRL